MKSKLRLFSTRTGIGVAANTYFDKDDHILSFERNFVGRSTNKTLRVSNDLHQLSIDPWSPENFINHSCDPNSYIDWVHLELKALHPIKQKEEITYNYFTSDWDNEDVFECACGSLNCMRHISGFKNLPLAEKLAIRDRVSPFILSRFTDLDKE